MDESPAPVTGLARAIQRGTHRSDSLPASSEGSFGIFRRLTDAAL